MQSLRRGIRILQRIGGSGCSASPNSLSSRDSISLKLNGYSASKTNIGSLSRMWMMANEGIPSMSSLNQQCRSGLFQLAAVMPPFQSRASQWRDTVETPSNSSGSPAYPPAVLVSSLRGLTRPPSTFADKEAVEEVKAERDIPNIGPGYIIQLKVEVSENRRRVSVLKGIVIARRNAGLNTTFRLRRLVAGVGVESLFPLYSPNIKEIKVLDKKKVRRAKLYYLREKMNALKKQR